MASSLVEFQTATANNSALVFPALTGVPAAAVTDDVVMAFCFGKSTTGTWTPPVGWTELTSAIRATPGLSYSISARRWSAGYTAPTFAWAGGGTNQTCVGFICVIRGIPASIPVADLLGVINVWDFAAGLAPLAGPIPTPLQFTSAPTDTLLAALWSADDANMAGTLIAYQSTSRNQFPGWLSHNVASTAGTDAAAILNLVVSHTANLTSWAAGYSTTLAAASVLFAIKVRREGAALAGPASCSLTAAGSLTTDPLGNLGNAPAAAAITATGYLITGPGLGAIGSMRGAAIYAHAFGAPPPPYTVTFGSVVEDDMLVVVVNIYNTANNTTYFVQTPAGWSTDGGGTIFGNRENWEKVRIYYRRATAADSGLVFSASPAFQQPSFTGYKLTAMSIQGVDWNRGPALQNQTYWGDDVSPYERRLAANTRPSMQLLAHAWQQNGTSNGATFFPVAGGGYSALAANSDSDSSWSGGTQILRCIDTEDRAAYAIGDSPTQGRGANYVGTFSIKAANYGQFFSEGIARLTLSAAGALTTAEFGGSATLSIDASGTLTSPAALFIALSSSGARLEIVATASTLLNPTPVFYVAGLATQYRMDGIGKLATGQTLEVLIDGMAAPCSALTVRSGDALGQQCTATLHQAVMPGSALVVNLRFAFPGGGSSAEVFSGTVTAVHGDAGRASVQAVGTFAARLPSRPEPGALLFASNDRVRVGADFFTRPGDVYQAAAIRQVVTSCQARGPWFTEFELL